MSLILTCNAGSSNTKLAAFEARTLKCTARTQTGSTQESLAWLREAGDNVVAIGHRVVHGGREFIKPARLTPEVIAKLEALIPLAPLHQPAALKLIEEVQTLYPNVPHIACFDTAFHHTMPEVERRLPLPVWYHKEGIQRYGFHGLSYQHIASVLPQQAGKKSIERVIAVHLGGGASACAMKNLHSVATTMGFSTLDGMMMGTRSGAIDPGVLLHLLKQMEMRLEEVDRLLYLESGLQGVSGVSSDMRVLLASDKKAAHDTVELYCYLAARQIGSLLPALGGLDALVFTGGIGEHNEAIRKKIIDYLHWAGDFSVYVIPADEETVIADACRSFA